VFFFYFLVTNLSIKRARRACKLKTASIRPNKPTNQLMEYNKDCTACCQNKKQKGLTSEGGGYFPLHIGIEQGENKEAARGPLSRDYTTIIKIRESP
jgi:hypothetical protein